MITLFSTDESLFAAFTAELLIGQGDLKCGINGFRTRVGKKDVVQRIWEVFDQPVGKIEGKRVTAVKAVGKIDRFELCGNGIVDCLTIVTCIDAPESSATIQHLMAVTIGVVHPASFNDKPGILFEIAMCRERHKKRVKVLRYQVVINLVHRNLLGLSIDVCAKLLGHELEQI